MYLAEVLAMTVYSSAYSCIHRAMTSCTRLQLACKSRVDFYMIVMMQITT